MTACMAVSTVAPQAEFFSSFDRCLAFHVSGNCTAPNRAIIAIGLATTAVAIR